MKSFKILFFSIVFVALANVSFAQTSTEKIKVAGECGTCKKKIEKAAKSAGATYAVWSSDNKLLTVKFNNASTTKAKIEQSVADAGYDTEDIKATDEAYHKLDDCCQYERKNSSAKN